MGRIEIDGSILEGGGQILRMSVALSAVTGKPIRIYNVRAKRSPPGLRAQHMNAVRALAQLADAEVAGLGIGSKEIEFNPGSPKGGSFKIDVGTAGSTSLVLQALMPVMSFSLSKTCVEITGGTNNPMAPAVEYLQEVLLPAVSKMGYKGSIELLRRGFYPRGQGIVRAAVEPIKALKPIIMEKLGEVEEIKGLSYSVERMARSAERVIRGAGYKKVKIDLEALQASQGRCAADPGCGIILFAKSKQGAVLGADSLGELGKPAEKVGTEVAEELLRQLVAEAPVDRHLADQLIVYMSLADGRSTIRTSELTLHAITCIHLSGKMVGARFKVEGEEGAPSTIVCDGIGLKDIFVKV
jgi:RNA 3'-terminal phosphate cyclase (ATP)